MICEPFVVHKLWWPLTCPKKNIFLQEEQPWRSKVNICRSRVNTPPPKKNYADQMSTNFRKVVAFDLPHVLTSAEPCISANMCRSLLNIRSLRQIKGHHGETEKSRFYYQFQQNSDADGRSSPHLVVVVVVAAAAAVVVVVVIVVVVVVVEVVVAVDCVCVKVTQSFPKDPCRVLNIRHSQLTRRSDSLSWRPLRECHLLEGA